ncbi:hypothetical protein AB0K16_56445, partial [Nonomuraea jabiensis]|uniref:hypothetical protein n=1 Tax=Nonomuraea jabiensis TaxID=882448 RepID=UPI0034133FE7
ATTKVRSKRSSSWLDARCGSSMGRELILTRITTTMVVDGRPVAVTGGRDRTLRLWDLTSGRQIGPDLHFPKPVTAAAISEDGHVIVCFDRDIAVFTSTPAPPDQND